MKLTIEGFSAEHERVVKVFKNAGKDIPQLYKKIVDANLKKVQDIAVAKLNKPNWLLSSYIQKKVHLYKNGRFVFGMTGVLADKGRTKNKRSPGYYAKYHEFGYFTQLNKVKKPKKSRIKKKYKGHDLKDSYQLQKGKHFLKKAFKEVKQSFLSDVRAANLKIEAALLSGEKMAEVKEWNAIQ